MQIFDEAARDGLRTIAQIVGPPRAFDAPMAAALTEALARIDTAPQSIGAADRAQQQLLDLLGAHRHRAAAFLEVYHGITVAVIQAIADRRLGPGYFFERLAGRFAERHFDGLKAELGLNTTSDAARYQLWRPSFALDNVTPEAGSPFADRPPLIHFTVGMCCHINLDLALALDETIRQFGLRDQPDAIAEVERGHNFVDSILAEKVEGSTQLLAEQFDCPLSKRIMEAGAVKLVGEQSMVTIRRWRAQTFPNALKLAAAPSEEVRAQLRDEIYRAGARKTVRLFNLLPDLIQATMSGAWWRSAAS
jgi:hypothetical protein